MCKFTTVLLLLYSRSFLTGQTTPRALDTFSGISGATKFPFDFSQGIIVVPITINGSRPLHFVLDSGSTRTLIDRAVAASLGLKEGEASSVQGAGKGRIPIHAIPDINFALPGLNTNGYECFAIDLAPVAKSVGIQEDGILGYNFFARFVIQIDFEAKELTLVRPADFRPPSSFQELPLDIRGKWPYVKGELVFPGPITQQDSFFIDSGSSDAVDHPLVRTLQSRTPTTTGVGLGTPIEGALAVATSFRLGRFTIKKPIVACCGATEATSRMIGTEILRRFTVIFDYPSAKLFVRPNHSLHAPFGRNQ